MDVEGLQGALRRFAAERNWEPFHTPKNLAMALMVEAAELVGIFQWMTPEESREARNDPPTKQRIGEELADILLYLLQVADHTETDLGRAALDKLVKNAQKYPPAWKANLDLPVETAGSSVHVLLDYENVQPTEDELRALVPEATNVWVFHGPHQKQVEQRFSAYGKAVTAVPISKTGKNALDFHLSFYMGYITSRNQDAKIVVVANDTGYEPVLEHANAMGFSVRRHGHLRAVVAANPTASVMKVPAKNTAVTKKVAVSKNVVVAKTAAAKTAATKRPQRPATKKSAKAPSKSVAAAPKTPASTKTAAEKIAVKASPSPAATAQKTAASLRRMGDKRPSKSASLRRALKSLLGPTASDDEVIAAFNGLVDGGVIVVGPDSGVSYPGLV